MVDAEVRARAVQLVQSEVVVSHWSAAVLHGIEVLDEPPVVEVTGAEPRRMRVEGVRRHCLPLRDGEVTRVRGLRVTSVPRTLADLLRAAGEMRPWWPWSPRWGGGRGGIRARGGRRWSRWGLWWGL